MAAIIIARRAQQVRAHPARLQHVPGGWFGLVDNNNVEK